jgi:hypothetical protein
LTVVIPAIGLLAIVFFNLTVAARASGEPIVIAGFAVIVPAVGRFAFIAQDRFVAIAAGGKQLAKTVLAIIGVVDGFRILDFFAAMGADCQTIGYHGANSKVLEKS